MKPEPRSGGTEVVSLFCGSGGLDLGFEQEGFVPILASDIDRAACETFKGNRLHSDVITYRADLSATDPSDLVAALPSGSSPKGVIGGPPCQAFSVGNVYKRRDDPRAKLPTNYAAAIATIQREYELDFFVFENVAGIRSNRHRSQFQVFKQLFEDVGFRLFEEELNAAAFGVPQQRRRVFVVGLNAKRYPDLQFRFPKPCGEPTPTVRQAIEGLPEPLLFERGLQPDAIRNRAGHPNHWTMRPRSPKLANRNGELEPGDRRGRGFRVLEWDKPSLTVAYGHREIHVHPDMKRRLSIHEAMLLQGFPIEYQLFGNLSDQVRMVSDAVPPPLARRLAASIRTQLYHD